MGHGTELLGMAGTWRRRGQDLGAVDLGAELGAEPLPYISLGVQNTTRTSIPTYIQ
jgi:hypothetical protein